jgi:tRNA U55 pseudouridine synthase TruB
LRRLSVDPYSVADAITADELSRAVEGLPGKELPGGKPKVPIIPLSEALAHVPRISVDQESARRIVHGVPLEKALSGDALALLGEGYTRLCFGDELIALVHGKTKPTYFKVFG